MFFPRPSVVKRALLKGPVARRLCCHQELLFFCTVQPERQHTHERTLHHAWEVKHELWCLLSSHSESSVMFPLSYSVCRHLVLIYHLAFLWLNLCIRWNGGTTLNYCPSPTPLKWLRPSYDGDQGGVLS